MIDAGGLQNADVGPLRVLVVARQPVARAGLRALLDERPDVEVVGQAASVVEVERLAAELAPAAAVASWDAADADGLATLGEVLTSQGVPLVLLAAEAPFLTIGERASPRGVLPVDATAADVAIALRAVVRGLLVADPMFFFTLAGVAGSDPHAAPVEGPLTDRERGVLDLLALGLPNKTIALRLGISEHTVKFHVGSIFSKLDVGSRTEAVTVAARRGLVAL